MHMYWGTTAVTMTIELITISTVSNLNNLLELVPRLSCDRELWERKKTAGVSTFLIESVVRGERVKGKKGI